MKKETKIIIAIVIVAVLAFVIWQIIKWRNSKKSAESTTETPTGTGTVLTGGAGAGTGAGGLSYTDNSFPLKLGSGGENIKQLQMFLNNFSIHYNLSTTRPLVEDGKLGNGTIIVLNKIKSMANLPVNGEVSLAEFTKYVEPFKNMTQSVFDSKTFTLETLFGIA